MADVSIIIATYNRLWSLPRAINSCRQTNCEIQIIVVDDGSTDGTWEWLTKQDAVTSIRQENKGQTYAINRGLAEAKGTFIRFLDSDDFLSDGTIDKQYKVAIELNADLVYGRVDHFNQADCSVMKCPEVGRWDDFLELQLSNRYGSHFLGMLFHRSLVEKVPRRPEFAFREDRMFLLEIGLLFPKLARTDGCAGYWVKHADQMQGNYIGLQSQVTNWQHLQIFKKIIETLEKRQQLKTEYKKAACTVLWPLAHWIAKNHISDAMAIIKWIYQLDPNFQVPEKGLVGLSYKLLGFRNTQILLTLRRKILYIEP